jgi:GDP-mannose 6-dehydrogenase
VHDFVAPSRTILGTSSKFAAGEVASWYGNQTGHVVQTDYRTAETAKVIDNVFHALKIAFANEVGTLASKYGIDAHEIMRILTLDTKLNISAHYLRPGAPFGGSCLPKEVRLVNALSDAANVSLPVISGIMSSNYLRVDDIANLVPDSSAVIGLIGVAFKYGTDDLRESPSLAWISDWLERGHQVRAFDSHVKINQLVGSNQSVVSALTYDLASVMSPTLDAVLEEADTVVVASDFDGLGVKLGALKTELLVIDLVGIRDVPLDAPARFVRVYDGR